MTRLPSEPALKSTRSPGRTFQPVAELTIGSADLRY
jgi:hypothetical protein